MRAGRFIAAVVFVGAACSSGGSPSASTAPPTVPATDAPTSVVDGSSPALPASSCRDPEPSVVVWLAIDATPTQVDSVKASLIATSGVDQVIFIDKDAAYAEFRELFPDSPEMLASVKPADLPASFRVVSAAPLPIATVDNWASIPGVDSTTLNPCPPQVVPPTK